MDILQDFIKSLAKEEVKSYKLFTKRTHDFAGRKDIDLFDSIKKYGDESDAFHHLAIYHKAKPDAKYYRLKNKIVDDLGVVLTNLNHRRPEIDALHVLSIAKIFNFKKQFQLSFHYLKLAERRSLDKEDYALLEAIYEQMIRLSMKGLEISPAEIIDKRKENANRLSLLQELENNLAILSYELKTTQNLTTKKAVTAWLHQTLKSTMKLAYVKNSPQLRLKIFQNLSRLMLLLKDYQSLEVYLKTCLQEFEEDNLLQKDTHDIKLQLLVYLCNASFMLDKYTQSIQYANLFYKALFEHGKIQYDQYVFYYYNILVNNYSKTNVSKAIDTLLEAQQQQAIRNNPTNYFYVLSNLAISYFDSKKYKMASKLFSQIYVLPNYKSFDVSFKIKLELFEIMNRVELQEFDVCEKQLAQLHKLMSSTKEKETIREEIDLVNLLEDYLKHEDKRWRLVKPSIRAFIEKFPSTNTHTGLINYSLWLSTKI